MTITQLIYFESVSKTLNIVRTAEQFQVSPPAVSKAIRELEKEYRIVLFQRDGNRLLLTPEGIRFQEVIGRFLGHYREMERELQNEETNPAGAFRLSVLDHFIVCSWPVLHEYMTKRYPGLNVEMSENGIGAIDRMRLGLLDGVLWTMNDADPANDYLTKNNTRAKKIGTMKWRFYCRRNLLRTDHDTIKAAELKDVPMVVFKTYSKKNYLEDILSRELEEPNIVHTTSQMYIAVTAVNKGLAGTVLPEFDYGFSPEIRSFTLQEFSQTNIFFLYQNETAQCASVMQALREFYAEK